MIPDCLIGEKLTEHVEKYAVYAVHKRIVGKETAHRLGLGRWNGILEKEMKADVHTRIYIDFDANNGETVLHCLKSVTKTAIAYFEKKVSAVIERFRSKVMELPISSGNPVSLVVSQGGETSELLYPGEYISVLVGNIQAENLDSEDIERIFTRFGFNI